MELNERDTDWQKDAPTLAAIGNVIPFTLPSKYFEELSDNLNARVLIESICLNDREIFKVPDNYFSELSSRIENRLSIENIRSLVPSEGFVLPEGYFDELSNRINSQLPESKKKNNCSQFVHLMG